MGLLRSRVGGRFDLPTAAQREYACRAGTTTAWNNGSTITGSNTDSELDKLGWYKGNASTLHPVGQLLANAWGLYDMHGNVWQWCLDWWQDDLGTADAIDPVSGFRWKMSPVVSTRSFRVFLTLP